jgi:hypothetical protein
VRRSAALGLTVAATLLVSGCAADVRGELRRDVSRITDEANARDAEGVRRGVDRLLDRLPGAVDSGEVSSAEAARIAELARLLRDRADLLEPEQEPEPTEEPTREPAPTTAPPSPSPSPPPPAPSPEPEPEPEPDDDDEPTLVPELPGG